MRRATRFGNAARGRATTRNAALWLAVLCTGVIAAPTARAQFGSGNALLDAKNLIEVKVEPVTLRAKSSGEATVTLTIQPSWHINANPASPDYMIATQLEVRGQSGVTVGLVSYPAARPLKVEFDDSAMLVYDGAVNLRLPLRAALDATNGTHRLAGKLTFQACNDKVCMPPETIPVEITVVVSGGIAHVEPEHPDTARLSIARAPPDTTSSAPTVATPESAFAAVPDSTAGFATMPPASGTTALPGSQNRLASTLERGGFAAFLMLFGFGLALNLTPCVYPMIGVTLSIFGARRAAPPLQVFGYALVYVLGMAAMYSTLGLTAALTGGLFGAVLQNVWVQAGLGLLLIALSLSMFGLYQLQVPPELLSRFGGSGTTSIAGVFLSGLMVGIFAAPCVGPPVVGLLAVVAAKGDPWYGFWSFFVLAMGLGAPYLVLGTFTNLLKSLPRSGDWLIWMERVFGVILFSLGAFYLLLGLAPRWATWVLPAALILGGIHLGYIVKNADQRRGFWWGKRIGGALAVVAAIAIVVTAPAPTEGITFKPFSATALEAALGSGRPAMIDFTANWCAPCHELERMTFTDPAVRSAAKNFHAFRVDLTHFNSPEAEEWRRNFAIRGVPTVLFLVPGGGEVRDARVEGFIDAKEFLDRLRLVQAETKRAAAD